MYLDQSGSSHLGDQRQRVDQAFGVLHGEPPPEVLPVHHVRQLQ
jgi:hypothetical protein